VQPQEKQLVREKEMQPIKLQQEKDLQQDENVVQLQNVVLQNVEDQHEEKQLQNVDQHEEEDDNLFFSLFLFTIGIELLFYLEISERSMS